MRILGIDTTGPHCSAAIVDESRIFARRVDLIKRGHAEHLAVQVQDLFNQINMKPADIDRIVVCIGPGSFTGLRVGIALAKGLALPRKIPVIGLSALTVWAAMADAEQEGSVLSIADVRRGEVFWQSFKNGAPRSQPRLSDLAAAKAALTPKMIVTGNGAPLLTDTQTPAQIDPAILAWLGMDLNPALNPASPLYHRAPDAKLPGGITPK